MTEVARERRVIVACRGAERLAREGYGDLVAVAAVSAGWVRDAGNCTLLRRSNHGAD